VDTADGTDAAGTYTESGDTFTFSASFYDGPDLIERRGDGSFSTSSMTVNFRIYVNGTLWGSGTTSFTKQ